MCHVMSFAWSMRAQAIRGANWCGHGDGTSAVYIRLSPCPTVIRSLPLHPPASFSVEICFVFFSVILLNAPPKSLRPRSSIRVSSGVLSKTASIMFVGCWKCDSFVWVFLGEGSAHFGGRLLACDGFLED